jgi:hypothetical protein
VLRGRGFSMRAILHPAQGRPKKVQKKGSPTGLKMFYFRSPMGELATGHQCNLHYMVEQWGVPALRS